MIPLFISLFTFLCSEYSELRELCLHSLQITPRSFPCDLFIRSKLKGVEVTGQDVH